MGSFWEIDKLLGSQNGRATHAVDCPGPLAMDFTQTLTLEVISIFQEAFENFRFKQKYLSDLLLGIEDKTNRERIITKFIQTVAVRSSEFQSVFENSRIANTWNRNP